MGWGEGERRPLVGAALGPDPPAVSVDDALDEGQTDPRPFELVVPVQSLKDPEQLACITHVEARAVIPNVERGFAAFAPRPDLDARFRATARELEGVADEVGQDLAQQGEVAPDGWKGRHRDVKAARGLGLARAPPHRLGGGGGVTW